MKTVGNDLVRHQLHENRKWYLALGTLLTLFGLVMFISLPFATLTAVLILGGLMMFGGVFTFIAAFNFFEGGYRWLWALSSILYIIAGYYVWATPVQAAIVLTAILAIFLIISGILRTLGALLYRIEGWGWSLFSGILTFVTGIIIMQTPDAPFWVLGLFLAMDILFQGINYLRLASYIRREVPKSSAD